MTITHKEHWPRHTSKQGSPTDFREKLLDGRKKHSLLVYDKARVRMWRQVAKLHHAIKKPNTKYEPILVHDNPGKVQVIRLEISAMGALSVYVYDGLAKQYRAVRDVAGFVHNEGFDSVVDFVDWYAHDVQRGFNVYMLVHYYSNYCY